VAELWDSGVGASEVDAFKASAWGAVSGAYSKGGESEGGYGFEINRYRIGDAFIRSCAADSEANSARKVFGEGVRGLYCQLNIC
jgi:hypothetical protein